MHIGGIMSFFMGELVGTAILTLFGCGVVANVLLAKSKGFNGGWVVIALGWGFAVTFGVYASGQYSGGHLNPALTIAFAVAGLFDWHLVPVYIAGQMIGAIIGGVLTYLIYLPHWGATEDADTKLAVFCTQPAIRHTPANFLSEFLGTAVLAFGLLAIGANQFVDGINPLIAGFFITAIGLSLGGSTGYAINPARDLGPRIAHALMPIKGKRDADWGYAWLPVVAPICGAIAGVLLYVTLVTPVAG